MKGEFMYLNERRICEIAERYFGYEGRLPRFWNIRELEVCKYILAYCILNGRYVNPESYTTLKNAIAEKGGQLQDKKFFEKVEEKEIDYMYFKEFMEKAESDSSFLDSYHVWFSRN